MDKNQAATSSDQDSRWIRAKARLLAAITVAVSIALHSQPAAADADRDPLEYSLREYGLVLALALLGGIVSFYAKVRAGQVAAWNVMHFVGELATSAFAGLLTFWLCESAGAPKLVTICMVGIAGHMGARAISAFEAWAYARWSGQAGASSPGQQPPRQP